MTNDVKLILDYDLPKNSIYNLIYNFDCVFQESIYIYTHIMNILKARKNNIYKNINRILS